MGSSASEPYALGDPLNQKDQTVHLCFQGTDAIDQLVSAPFKPGQPVGQIVFKCDQDRSVMIASRTIRSAGGAARPRRITRPSVRPSGGSSGRTTILFSGGPSVTAGPGTIAIPRPADTALLIASMPSNSMTGRTSTPPACNHARLNCRWGTR